MYISTHTFSHTLQISFSNPRSMTDSPSILISTTIHLSSAFKSRDFKVYILLQLQLCDITTPSTLHHISISHFSTHTLALPRLCLLLSQSRAHPPLARLFWLLLWQRFLKLLVSRPNLRPRFVSIVQSP